MKTIVDCLRERGLVDAVTSEELEERVKTPMKVYLGFDPTADSLHIGSLVGIVILRWFQKFGHTPVVILGGATGRIGDPSGKSAERPLLDDEAIEYNVSRIRRHFEEMLDARAVILNNNVWYQSLSVIDFLRDVGKHFRIGSMLAKESVRARMESEEGMSFTEFSYQVLQGFDFYYLLEHHKVELQLGGSDQWGNITAGTDLIRKLSTKSAYGLTFPLLTRSDGKKFGKTEGGAVWISADRTSPYEFYQYFIRIADADVVKMMKMLTFMEMGEIREIEARMGQSPNLAQRRLAEEVTRFVHGEEGLATAMKVTDGAAPGAETVLDVDTLRAIAKDMPGAVLGMEEVVGQKFVDVAVKTGLLASKGEALRLIENNGAYLNNVRIGDPHLRIEEKDLIGGIYLLFGAGKKKKLLLSVQKPLA